MSDKELAKMNIISAYMLGWITFGEALERLKNLQEDDNVVDSILSKRTAYIIRGVN